MAYSEELWKQAKAKCRLNMEEIEIAKKLGINPKSLIKNIPNKNELWKAPVGEWLRDIYAKRQKEAAPKEKRKDLENKPSLDIVTL
ncbi:MAG: hypothetical protein FWF87_08065 [Synergistaceae bacterium]|nr:hypothetical protein [Synergistaceae bacterium]